jgi:hypothetical protein
MLSENWTALHRNQGQPPDDQDTGVCQPFLNKQVVATLVFERVK